MSEGMAGCGGTSGWLCAGGSPLLISKIAKSFVLCTALVREFNTMARHRNLA